MTFAYLFMPEEIYLKLLEAEFLFYNRPFYQLIKI